MYYCIIVHYSVLLPFIVGHDVVKLHLLKNYNCWSKPKTHISKQHLNIKKGLTDIEKTENTYFLAGRHPTLPSSTTWPHIITDCLCLETLSQRNMKLCSKIIKIVVNLV